MFDKEMMDEWEKKRGADGIKVTKIQLRIVSSVVVELKKVRRLAE